MAWAEAYGCQTRLNPALGGHTEGTTATAFRAYADREVTSTAHQHEYPLADLESPHRHPAATVAGCNYASYLRARIGGAWSRITISSTRLFSLTTATT